MDNQSENKTVLKAENLQKSYGQLNVLNNVSISIRSGEFVSVTGHSGAGKSTLLHILGGLDKPDKGAVRLLDEDIFKLSARKQLRFRNEHIGFVFQFHHLLPEFTAIENVSMPLWIKGLHKNEAEKQALAVLDRVGLSHRAKHKPGALSGGEQQRVAIARALINQPDIIFADEPTGNLDSENASIIHQLFLDLQKELRLTFIVVTHNEELAALADRELKMKDGVFIKEN